MLQYASLMFLAEIFDKKRNRDQENISN